MARKQLIKGANATRVEERIARVPADLGPGAESGLSIFGALRALEEGRPEAPRPKAPGGVSRPRAQAPKASKPSGEDPAPRSVRIGPSDFNNAEREAIVRCCSDYRNRLPTYLLATQRELKVIDSVIDKCRTKRK
jgi:hypothetical protein